MHISERISLSSPNNNRAPQAVATQKVLNFSPQTNKGGWMTVPHPRVLWRTWKGDLLHDAGSLSSDYVHFFLPESLIPHKVCMAFDIAMQPQNHILVRAKFDISDIIPVFFMTPDNVRWCHRQQKLWYFMEQVKGYQLDTNWFRWA